MSSAALPTPNQPLRPFLRMGVALRASKLSSVLNKFLPGEQGLICHHQSNPRFGQKKPQSSLRQWHFEHGRYSKRRTALGHTQISGNKRIDYFKSSNTVMVYALVEGLWKLREIRRRALGLALRPISALRQDVTSGPRFSMA